VSLAVTSRCFSNVLHYQHVYFAGFDYAVNWSDKVDKLFLHFVLITAAFTTHVWLLLGYCSLRNIEIKTPSVFQKFTEKLYMDFHMLAIFQDSNKYLNI